MTNEEDWDNPELNSLFERALRRSQTDFIKLFLDHDFSLTDLFRDNNKLPSLYAYGMKEHKEEPIDDDDPLRVIYQKIIQPLIGDFFEVDAALPKVKSSSDDIPNDYNISESCSCCAPFHRKRQNQISAQNDSHMDVDKELFVWSVITRQSDLHFLFWARGKNKIAAALFAAIAYRKNARKTNDNSDYQRADDFENLAVQILGRFYEINPRHCTKAIIRQIPAYGNATWLELAVRAEAKQFIAQRAVQDVLNNIWYGFIDQRESLLTIMFSTVMIWYSGFLRYHDELVKTIDETSPLEESFNKAHIFDRKEVSKAEISSKKTTNEVQLKLLNDVENEKSQPVQFRPIGCFENSAAD